jgi:hypothetical protein
LHPGSERGERSWPAGYESIDQQKQETARQRSVFVGFSLAGEASKHPQLQERRSAMQSNQDKDPVIPAIPVSEGSLFHTPDHPFCYDETCSCHENPVLIAAVADAVNQGLLTLEEATHLVAGKTI